jgi:hypothetical protein
MSNLPTRPRPAPLLSLSAAMLLTSMALTGCKGDSGPGTLSVEFVLGNDKTCDEVDVESVRVALSRGDEVLYEEIVPCGSGPVIVDDIAPQTYDLVVEGIDAMDYATFDNLGTPAGERKIEIFDGALADVAVDLTARPADLAVAWNFGVTNCMGAGVDRFRIRAFEVGGGNLLLEHEIDCDATGEGAGGYRPVPDPDRVLNGTLLGEVGVVPLDAAGTMVGGQVTFAFEPVGPGHPVNLTLQCNDMFCTGTGVPDSP